MSDITDPKANQLVTAYSVLRPDGQWSLLLVNKDQFNPQPVLVDFHNSSDNSNHYFQGSVPNRHRGLRS